jgi:hypothetical protein
MSFTEHAIVPVSIHTRIVVGVLLVRLFMQELD